MSDERFEDTVKNLLKMKPKPHDEAKGEKGRDKPAPSKANRSKDD